MDYHPNVDVKVEDSAVVVENPRPAERQSRAMHGTMRALINNMVTGVSQGFSRTMQIFGTGYSVKEQGGKLVLNVGYCHPVEMKVPKSIKVDIKTPATRGNDVPAVFICSGPDKHELGQFLSNVRKVRPPEPYKGKGIRYADEYVRRKEGKAFGAGG
jgi:large subunit ribosomal protein L6